jgi:hypothetical protein
MAMWGLLTLTKLRETIRALASAESQGRLEVVEAAPSPGDLAGRWQLGVPETAGGMGNAKLGQKF